MDVLATASGVIKKVSRLYIIQKDVMQLLGCKESKAYDIVREVNEQAKKKGKHPFPAGRANKYLFAEMFEIPIEEVDEVISREYGDEEK